MKHPDLAARFTTPSSPAHRRYEALRSVFVDELPVKKAADLFDYAPGTLYNLASEFRNNPDLPLFPLPAPPAPKPPPKSSQTADRESLPQRVLALRRQNYSANQISAILRPQGLPASVPTVSKILRELGCPRLPRRSPEQRDCARPLLAAACDVSQLDLSPRSFRTHFGGLFLFLPALLRLNLPDLARRCELPGSSRIPPTQAALSFLALKLWGVGRPFHVMPDCLDQGIALFAGLNSVPKRSTLAEYTCRFHPDLIPKLCSEWCQAATPLGLFSGSSFDLDFHTIPYHGDNPTVEKHWISKRSRRQKGILAMLARDASDDVLCYSNTNLRKEDQARAVLAFIDEYQRRTKSQPTELVFDSTFTTYAVMAEIDKRGIRFLTLRRRPPKQIPKLLASPGWKRIQLHNIARKFRHPHVLDQTIQLKAYGGSLRQIAIDKIGRPQPILLLTNDTDSKPAELVSRYARRMIIENAIAESINFFHMDALSSVVHSKVDADLCFTLMAGSLYRHLARTLGKRHQACRARQIFEHFVRTTATIRIHPDCLEVRLGRRANNPALLAAGFHEDRTTIPWLNNLPLKLVIGLEDH